MPSDDAYEPDDAAGQAAGVGERASVESRVQDGLTGLDGLDSRPLTDHAPAYEALHERLQSVLAEIDGA